MSFWRRPSERLRRFGFASHCEPHSLPCPRTARTGRASRRHLQSICCKSQRRGQNRSRRPERSRRRDRRDSSHSISRNLGTPSDLMTREKRESGPQPFGYPHSRAENTRKIANRKATINRRHPGCSPDAYSLAALAPDPGITFALKLGNGAIVCYPQHQSAETAVGQTVLWFGLGVGPGAAGRVEKLQSE